MADKQQGGATLSALSREITQLAEHAAKGVVSLSSRGGFPTSGTVWEKDYVVTADHVLHDGEGAVVTLDDGSERSAEVVGRDPGTDIALLKVETGAGAFAEKREAAKIQPGTLVLALGRNSERSLNVSLAVVNAVGGEWRSPGGGVIDAYIRIDVRMHAGFSGGPLIDGTGALIGIGSSRLSHHSPVALPVSTVSRVVAELKEHGRIRRGYLGVASFPVGLDDGLRGRLGLKQGSGLVVLQVEEGSGAQAGGLLQGDILLDIAGNPIRDPEELQAALGPDTVGATVTVRIARGGVLQEIGVEVGERPAASGSWRRGWPSHRRAHRGGR